MADAKGMWVSMQLIFKIGGIAVCLHINDNPAEGKGTYVKLNPEKVTKHKAREDGGSELQTMNEGTSLEKKELLRKGS